MIIASSLSFLGLGSRPPVPEWGYMLDALRPHHLRKPVVVALPGVMIFVTRSPSTPSATLSATRWTSELPGADRMTTQPNPRPDGRR